MSYDTPVIVTASDPLESGKSVRKRFCCMEHMAAWAVKETAKSKGARVSSSVEETKILDGVRQIVESFVI